jgi:hypothetical protein
MPRSYHIGFDILKIMQTPSEKPAKRFPVWIAVSFVIGFIVVGGFMDLWALHEELKRPSMTENPLWDYISCAVFGGVPGGLLAIGVVTAVRRSFKDGWWHPGSK